jgi:hypothetical protein
MNNNKIQSIQTLMNEYTNSVERLEKKIKFIENFVFNLTESEDPDCLIEDVLNAEISRLSELKDSDSQEYLMLQRKLEQIKYNPNDCD